MGGLGKRLASTLDVAAAVDDARRICVDELRNLLSTTGFDDVSGARDINLPLLEIGTKPPTSAARRTFGWVSKIAPHQTLNSVDSPVSTRSALEPLHQAGCCSRRLSLECLARTALSPILPVGSSIFTESLENSVIRNAEWFVKSRHAWRGKTWAFASSTGSSKDVFFTWRAAVILQSASREAMKRKSKTSRPTKFRSAAALIGLRMLS